ncbi:enoyl-CoA hydratase family protein [Cognatishimia sp.]|uniref:enoyl-CoA hydratase family protein n=1 Tax=Cognatishimia sp. TaxID=2211648 RepID=UPI003516BD33
MTARIEETDNAIIVFNRAEKRGALSPEFYEKIVEGAALAAKKRALVLTGQGYFCAGGDLETLKQRATLPYSERRAKIELLNEVVRAIRACPVPTIAAVEGGAAGAGLSLALACDFLIAAKGAQFAARYVNAGLTPDGGLTGSLSEALPRQLASEMCLLGRPQTAERLHSLGVVNTLTPEGEAMTAARALNQELSEGPRVAQERICTLLREAHALSMEQVLAREADYMAAAQAGPEAQEGISAFLEKRKARFV